jgi:plastocyanin
MRSRVYLVFALLTALSIGLWAQSSARNPLPTVSDAHAANLSIALVGSTSGWNASVGTPNPTITVKQGDIVTINLSSGDTVHQFALDVDKDGAKFTSSCSTGDTCSVQFALGSPTSVMINTSSLSGTYTYFCTIHSTMVGSFVVNSGSSVGGTILSVDKLSLILPYLIFAALAAVAVTSVVVYTRSRPPEKRSRRQGAALNSLALWLHVP